MAGSQITVVKYEPTDPRLGRHVEHDERSKNFAFLAKTAKPQKKTTHWTSQAPVLDQGNLGSCTGNAMAQWLNTDFATGARGSRLTPLNEHDAIDIYSKATRLDNVPGVYPPTDTGSSGKAAAKAAFQMSFLKSYSWTFSFSSAQAAIEKQPLMSGSLWTNDMFKCVNGLVKVGSLADSNIAGGHEYLMCGIDWVAEVFEFRQSWGQWTGAKPGGYFAIGFKDYHGLLDNQGDIVVPHWI